MIGIEIFSGAGGMSAGATLAGVDLRMAVDIDFYSTETFKLNHPEALVVNKDIRLIKEIPIKSVKNEQKILFGGPPCQGFSKSNHRTRNIENENNWLFKEFARIAKLWNPEWIILENVEGLLGTEKGLFFENILKSFERLGYAMQFKVLNAMHFGVPQNRNRLFIVGSLHNEPFNFPTENKKVITVKQAFCDLPTLSNGHRDIELSYKTNRVSDYVKHLRVNSKTVTNNGVSVNTELVLERYKHIPQGGNWQNIPKNLMTSYADASRCHTGIYHRLDATKPSVVIGNYRKNMLIHPTEDRGLSVREAARLQSFPDTFRFLGHLGNQQQQVGNAVPPLLAKKVFESINKK